MAIDANYVEDPWGEEGLPDLYADFSVADEPYYTSPVALKLPCLSASMWKASPFKGLNWTKLW